MSQWGLFVDEEKLAEVAADDVLTAVVAFASNSEYKHLLDPLRDQSGEILGAKATRADVAVRKVPDGS